MQGRQGPGNEEFGKGASGQRPSPLNGTGYHRAMQTGKQRAMPTGKYPAFTGEQRAIPRRPPGMRRLDTPPKTPRVSRPRREEARPVHLRRRLLVWGGIFLIIAVVAAFIGYGAVNFFNGLSISSGAASTAVDFLNALNHSDYEQAYKTLGPAITLHIGKDEFKQQAQALDQCYGPVKDYSQVQGSAQMTDNTQSYAYTIKREKLPQPYQLRLTLQKSQDNTWKITSYGGSLGPGQGAPPCGQ
ncbi:MAG: hypothetical protein IMW89_09130 [Ktedonobacteraceae bacterium]|nr:hypothetical protein [Ktedonobacteraceae bacterium]